MALHTAAEKVNIRRGQRESYSVGVPSEAAEESAVFIVRRGEGVEQMVAMNGASGSMRLAVLMGEYEGRPAGAIDDA